MTITNLQIGPAEESMVFVENIISGFPVPLPRFIPAVRYVDLPNRHVKARGLAMIEWRWSFLKWRVAAETYRDALRVFLPDPSNDVFIRTPTNENGDEYGLFSCIGIWPLEENKDTRRRIDFSIIFRDAVLIPEGS